MIKKCNAIFQCLNVLTFYNFYYFFHSLKMIIIKLFKIQVNKI